MDTYTDPREKVMEWAAGLASDDACWDCGYDFTDTEEGCDACAPIKAVVEAAAKLQAPPVTVDTTSLVEAYHAVYDIKDASVPGSEAFVRCYETLRQLADLIVLQGGERPDRYDQPPTKGNEQ